MQYSFFFAVHHSEVTVPRLTNSFAGGRYSYKGTAPPPKVFSIHSFRSPIPSRGLPLRLAPPGLPWKRFPRILSGPIRSKCPNNINRQRLINSVMPALPYRSFRSSLVRLFHISPILTRLKIRRRTFCQKSMLHLGMWSSSDQWIIDH